MPGEQARSKPALLCVPTIPRRPHHPARTGRVCLGACGAAVFASRLEGKVGCIADLGSGRAEPHAIGAVGRKVKRQGLGKLIRTGTEAAS
jgi:hypothetical protein